MPDTFVQSDHTITQSALAPGAGHTFAPDGRGVQGGAGPVQLARPVEAFQEHPV